MKLLTKTLEKRIPGLYETEGVPIKEKLVLAKLFHPAATWSWYVIEYDGKDTCWGLVDGDELEFGYFSLSELSRPAGYMQITVERDRWFRPTQIQDLPVYNIERVAA